MVQLLLDYGANIHHRDKSGSYDALRLAIGTYHMDRCKVLLEQGANVNLEIHQASASTPLQQACVLGFVDIVSLLLSFGADLHHVSKDGASPLLKAAQGGRDVCCKLLLEMGADIHHRDSHGRNALHFAMRTFNPTLCMMLLECGADPYSARIMRYLPDNIRTEIDRLMERCHDLDGEEDRKKQLLRCRRDIVRKRIYIPFISIQVNKLAFECALKHVWRSVDSISQQRDLRRLMISLPSEMAMHVLQCKLSIGGIADYLPRRALSFLYQVFATELLEGYGGYLGAEFG